MFLANHLEAPRLETLREQVAKLEKEVKALQKKVDKKVSNSVEAAAKDQIRFFLVKFFIPFFEGVCEVKGIKLEQAISDLIDENKTLDELFEDNIEKTSSLMESPEFKVILTSVRPIANESDEWIEDHSLIILEVMKEIRPEIAKVIYEADNGMKWLVDSLIGIKKMLFTMP